jgi:hypothetical protein
VRKNFLNLNVADIAARKRYLIMFKKNLSGKMCFKTLTELMLVRKNFLTPFFMSWKFVYVLKNFFTTAASIYSSLSSSSKRVAGANSDNICCLSKTFQEIQHLPTLLLTNWAIADVGQDAFDVEGKSPQPRKTFQVDYPFCRQANRIFYDGNFKVRFIFYIYRC